MKGKRLFLLTALFMLLSAIPVFAADRIELNEEDTVSIYRKSYR